MPGTKGKQKGLQIICLIYLDAKRAAGSTTYKI